MGLIQNDLNDMLNDLVTECFAINRIADRANINDILNRLKKTDNGGTDDGRKQNHRNHQRKDRCT